MKDKEYEFNEWTSPTDLTVIRVKEEDLTPSQKQLLLGELVNHWNDSPKDVQIEFMYRMLEEWKK